MVTINFPAGAVATDRYSDAGKTWEFDGSAWNPIVSTLQIPNNSIDTIQIINDAVTNSKIVDSAVTSAKIADGTIVNADINASAAIALSKLASGTEAQIMVVNSSGNPQYRTTSGDATISTTGVITTVKGAPITTVSSATYTFVLSDAFKYISFTNADATTLSVPLNASVAFAINDWIDFTSTTSPVIVSPVAGVTVNKSAGQWLVVMPHQKARLTKTDTNVWQFTISSLPSSFTEQIAVSATGATGTINIDFAVNASVLRTGNATGNFVLNIRGTSTVAMNDILAVGEVATVTFMATMGSTPYYATAYQVDGVAITPKWQGGTAISAGQASSINMYTVTLTKTASATYTAFASMTKFA